jgi:TonB family protein
MVGTLVFSLFLSWVQVSSDSYIVKSSSGEEKAKRVLKELEAFHQLLGTLTFRNTELPELPIEVLLVGDDAMMQELEPTYNGRKVSLAGYYQRGEDRDFIVLSGRAGGESLTKVVHHELSHYFLSRGLVNKPIWLNEGLAEYFAAAQIHDDEVQLGALYPERLQVLRNNALIPLKEFFEVDSSSAYYNESSKASVYYAEAWGFVHYMMQGEHAAKFKQYLDALAKGDANLMQFLKISDRDLELGFQNYVKTLIQYSNLKTVKISSEAWSMDVQSISDSEAEMSIAEIFLANGRLEDARHHLETLAGQVPDSPRVSYYRGILARISGDAGARDFFVDALLDPFLGPRAAVQLVESGNWHIPAVRSILEEAAASKTRNSRVYLALTTIYADEVREIQERVRLKQKSAVSDTPLPVTPPASPDPQTLWQQYVTGSADHVRYQVLSASDRRPELRTVVPPYYPSELVEQKLSGEVVIDVQVTPEGKAGGVWLVSALPDLFGTLATAAVREWEFEPLSEKVRVVLQFAP